MKQKTPEEKIGALIRRLASNHDGELVATVYALRRTLEGQGGDLHAFADTIERNGFKKFSEAEAQEIDMRGVEDGRLAAERAQPVVFRNVDGASNWHEMALWCQQHDDRLRANEREFVNDMASRTVWHEPTEKQGKWLKSIYLRLGGKV